MIIQPFRTITKTRAIKLVWDKRQKGLKDAYDVVNKLDIKHWPDTAQPLDPDEITRLETLIKDAS